MTRLENIEQAAQKLMDDFDKVGRYQSQRLGHGLQAACQCWAEASDTGGVIDFTGLRKALEKQDGDS